MVACSRRPWRDHPSITPPRPVRIAAARDRLRRAVEVAAELRGVRSREVAADDARRWRALPGRSVGAYHPGMPPCSAKGCDREARTAGLCQAHYMRQRRQRHVDGALRAPLSGPSEQLRFRVDAAVARRLEQEAKRRAVTVGDLLRDLVTSWLSPRR